MNNINKINIVFYSDEQRSDSSFEMWKSIFFQKDPKITFLRYDDSDAKNSNIALVWEPPKGLLNNYKNLKGVINLGQGVDHLIKPGIVPNGLPIIRLVDPEMSKTIASWTALQVLNEVCDFNIYQQQQRKMLWKGHPVQYSSYNWSIGILGLGAIGSYVAKSLLPFGFKVSGWSKSEKTIENINCYNGKSGFETVLKNSKILVCLLPLTKSTKHILNKRSFEMMPKGSSIINAGRGGHINEVDLLNMINDGHIKNAYLDVFEKEPLPSNHPFWKHKNVIVWPHVAGQTNRETAIDQIINASHCLVNNKDAPNTINRKNEY